MVSVSLQRPRAGAARHTLRALRAELKKISVLRTRARGAVLYRQGQRPRGVYLLAEGRAVLRLRNAAGHQVWVKTVAAPAIIGLPATLGNYPYLVSAELTAECRVGFISGRLLRELLRREPKLGLRVIELLGQETRGLVRAAASVVSPAM